MMAVFFFIAHEKGLKLAHILVLVSWLNQWFKLDQSRIMSLSGFHGFLGTNTPVAKAYYQTPS